MNAIPSWAWWLIAMVLVAGAQQYRVGLARDDAAEALVQKAQAEKDLSDYRLEVSERDRRAAVQARTEEQRRQAVADEADRKADEKYTDLEGRATDAESRAVGLRGEIDRLRAGHQATCDTIATQQRQAGTSAVVVLGGLLEEADRMAGSLAEALERSRIAGKACESIADGVKG